MRVSDTGMDGCGFCLKIIQISKNKVVCLNYETLSGKLTKYCKEKCIDTEENL